MSLIMIFRKLLGVKIDSKLYFWWSCKKANRKLQAFAPVTPEFPFDAQFNYCPLIWILQSRHNNKKIKHLQDVSGLFKMTNCRLMKNS